MVLCNLLIYTCTEVVTFNSPYPYGSYGLGRFQRTHTSNVYLGGGNSFFIFTPIQIGDDPIWRIFFRWVETSSWQWVKGSQSAMTGTKDVGPVPPTDEPRVTQVWVFVCFFRVGVLRLGDWYWSWTKSVFGRGFKHKSDSVDSLLFMFFRILLVPLGSSQRVLLNSFRPIFRKKIYADLTT